MRVNGKRYEERQMENFTVEIKGQGRGENEIWEVRREREEKRGKERGEKRAHTASSWLVLVDLIFLLRRSTWSLKCCMFFWSSSCCWTTSFRRLSCFLLSFCCSAARLVSLSRSTSNSRICDQKQNIKNNLTLTRHDSSWWGKKVLKSSCPVGQ